MQIPVNYTQWFPMEQHKWARQGKFCKYIFLILSRAIADTSPFWDQTLEFDYDNYASQGANVITITIFDSDSLGSDQQIATQAIPLQYFKERGKFGKPLDLWLKLGYLEDYGIREQIIVEGNGSLFVQTDTPDFPDQFATEEDKQNTSNISPLLHI